MNTGMGVRRERESPSDDEVPLVDVACHAGCRRGCPVTQPQQEAGHEYGASACLPDWPGHEGQGLLAAARSYRSRTQPRQRAAEPRGSVSVLRRTRRSAAGLCRASTRYRGRAVRAPPPTRRKSAGRAGPGYAADTASSGRPRCRNGAPAGAPGEGLPDTATPRRSLRPRRRSPDRSPGPAPPRSRRPAPDTGGAPAGHSAHQAAVRDGRRNPCGRSLAKGAACRRPARRSAPNCFFRCSFSRRRRSF